MATKHQHFTVNVPKTLKPRRQIALAKDIIKHIRERSQKNKDMEGKTFPQYSKVYAKKKGTSRGNVNLILDDKMLKAMKLLEKKPGKLDIGYDNGSKENAKADGNHRGTYGRRSPISGKARKFVGVSDKVLKQLVKKQTEIQRIASDVVKGIS